MTCQLRAQGRLVERLDPQTEVVQVAPFLARRGTTDTPEPSIDGHQVNERTSGSELNQADLILAPFDRAAKGIAVEVHHFLQVNDAEHEVIDVEETEHDHAQSNRMAQYTPMTSCTANARNRSVTANEEIEPRWMTDWTMRAKRNT